MNAHAASSRRTQVVAALVALLVVAGAAFLVYRVSSGDAAPAAQSTSDGSSASPSAKPAKGPATWPLTGLRVKGKGDGTQPWPAYVVKIDNTDSSAPQRGLDRADMVVEELVEGGTTRLAGFFHTRLPSVVGPVRSMRATDIGVVSQAKATIVTSGAAPPTIKRINGAGIIFLGEGNADVYRDSGRAAPYNLFANVQAIAKRARKNAPQPQDYFTWGARKDLPKGRRATGLAASFGRHTTTWQLEQGTYRTVDGHASADEQFRADSVVVIRVAVGDAGYRDPIGSFVPESKLTGTGPMMLFHGGRVVRGQWRKDSPGAPFVLRSGGRELPVPAGHTWVELVPRDSDGGGVSVTR